MKLQRKQLFSVPVGPSLGGRRETERPWPLVQPVRNSIPFVFAIVCTVCSFVCVYCLFVCLFVCVYSFSARSEYRHSVAQLFISVLVLGLRGLGLGMKVGY